MSIGPLLGVPGQLKILLNRLTQSRANNLNNLNASITSRAAAATAVSSVDLTPARIAKLDNLDARVSTAGGGGANKIQVFTASGTWTRPAGVDIVFLTMIGGGQSGQLIASNFKDRTAGFPGDYIVKLPVYVSSSMAVTIGAGGIPSAGNISKINGGNSKFGDNIIAYGGGVRKPDLQKRLSNSGFYSFGVDQDYVAEVSFATERNLGFGITPFIEGSAVQLGNHKIYGGFASPFGKGGNAANSTTGNGFNASGAGAGGGNALMGSVPRTNKGGSGSSGLVILEWYE